MKNKIILWSIIVLVIIGSVFGIIKLASKSQVSDSGSDTSALTISAINDNENIKGNKNATTTLIEYSDFQCPACGSYYPIVKKISEDMGEQVQFAYRHFPLPQHKNAKLAATVAEAAGKQGKFWEMHDLIFQNQSDWSEEKNASAIFAKYAQELNLDLARFQTDIASEEIKAKIENDSQSGVKAGVNSTPSFFLNGKKLDNPRNYDEFKNAIEQALGQSN